MGGGAAFACYSPRKDRKADPLPPQSLKSHDSSTSWALRWPVRSPHHRPDQHLLPPVQIVAAILAIAGIVMMTYADGFHSHSVIGIALVVGSASTSALYKVRHGAALEASAARLRVSVAGPAPRAPSALLTVHWHAATLPLPRSPLPTAAAPQTCPSGAKPFSLWDETGVGRGSSK